MRPICFISDYGLTHVMVGTCKGVMKGIAPEATIIDVTHTVPGFDVIRGAETLWHATRYMPEDSVYLAVVDPGTRDQEAGARRRGYRDEDFDQVQDKEVAVLLGRARRDQHERGATGLEGRR